MAEKLPLNSLTGLTDGNIVGKGDDMDKSSITVKQIVAIIGHEEIEHRIDVSEFSVLAVKRARLFPANWYGPLRVLCFEKGIDCPLPLFNMRPLSD